MRTRGIGATRRGSQVLAGGGHVWIHRKSPINECSSRVLRDGEQWTFDLWRDLTIALRDEFEDIERGVLSCPPPLAPHAIRFRRSMQQNGDRGLARLGPGSCQEANNYAAVSDLLSPLKSGTRFSMKALSASFASSERT